MNQRHQKIPAINRAFAAYPLRVARSRIQGYGVFAAGAIPRDRKVIEYTGERIRRGEAYARVTKLMGLRRPRRLFLFRLNRFWLIDGAVGGSGAEHINHSCDPNLRARIIRGHILYFSRRSIRPGEELSVDYGLSPKTFRVPCRCGSPNCRGFLNRE